MPNAEDELFVKLYTDADVHGDLAEQVREHGFEAWSAYEKNKQGLKDEPQLEYAVEQGWTLLTHNIKHFEPLYQKWFQAGKHHAGIIVSERLSLGELLKRILRLLNTIPAAEMQDNIKNLAEFVERRN